MITNVRDLPLKLRIKKILEIQGYHCPLEVVLSHFESQEAKQNLKRILLTDIDVLGIRFESDLRQTVIIADCKSGKESEANRIFWLRGVMDFFHAQEGIFIKTHLHTHARSLAPMLGIRVLDEQGLAILEKGLGLENTAHYADDMLVYERASNLWVIHVKDDEKPTERQLVLKSVYQYLQYKYWMADDYVNIQTIIELFSDIKSDITPDHLKSKFLAFMGLQRLSLSVLKMASKVAACDPTNVGRQFKIAFFGGEQRMNTSLQIIEYLNQINKHIRSNEKIELEPEYFNELAEIVNRIILNSLYASKILQHLDTVVSEHLFGSERNLEDVMGPKYSTEALVLLKRIATMFCKYTGIKNELFEKLWAL